jgi:hypothetical protein
MLRQREHDWAAPGPELAAQLAMVDPATIDDFELVELIAAFEQLSGWVAAGQVVAMAELSRRTVFEGCQLAPIRLAGMEVAARLSLAPATGEHRVTVARTLVDQLPDTLTALRRGDVDYRRAAVVAEAVPGLTPEQTEEVEGRVLPKAGSRSLGRHRAAVERAVLEVDPRGMEERHKTAVELRRIDFYPQPDGMGSAQAYLPADGLASLRAALDAAASAIRSDHPGDGRTMDQLRIDALVQMAQDSLRTGRLGGDGGGQRLATAHGRRPLIQVTVPFSTLLGLGDQPGRAGRIRPDPGIDGAPDRRRRHLASAADRSGLRRAARLRQDALSAATGSRRSRHRSRSALPVSRVWPAGLPLPDRPHNSQPGGSDGRHQPRPVVPSAPCGQDACRLAAHADQTRSVRLDLAGRPGLSGGA